MVTLFVTEQTEAVLSVELANEITLEVEDFYLSPGESFEGPYEWTPSEDTQTVPISEKKATQNIVINPIPSNYGLITYNGSVITVS